MKYRNRDPYWLTAKYPGTCKCGKRITTGDRIFFYPQTKTALCTECSKNAQADFNSAQFDERQYNS